MLETSRFAPNANLVFSRQGIVALGRMDSISLQVVDCLIIEQFVHESEAMIVYRTLPKIINQLDVSSALELDQKGASGNATAVSLRRGTVFESTIALGLESKRLANIATRAKQLFPNSSSEEKALTFATKIGIHVVTEDSRRGAFVTLRLAQLFGLRESMPSLSQAAFAVRLTKLVDEGLLTKCIGDVSWGDLSIRTPLCADYGYSRGTPLDRYYLQRFLRMIAPNVSGKVLEIGGRQENRELYGLTRSSNYTCLDISASPSAGDGHVTGDAHTATLFNEMTFDVVLAFNVLEHCKRPWEVLANIHKWLRSSGWFFGTVPVSQRIHRDPEDHWRILPDAFLEMLRSFVEVEVITFGNIKGCVASLYGIAAEEMTDEDRDQSDPFYPVVLCVKARKK